ncbi:MAG: 16S rRNA (cytosine(1402)-N(4))-methyltransferase RsmH [Clostridia bacterium]|nr:16S rRNA (cytosine(1402)-N(4))-methyltransferase RsmH [Clostridia bacterium]
MQDQLLHVPVLRDEVVDFLVSRPVRVAVDATVGAGGHAEALLRTGRVRSLIGLDRDTRALPLARERLAPWAAQVTLVHANFADLDAVLWGLESPPVDALLFDLGLSSMQVDEAQRGFSYQQDAPLDMRMDPGQTTTAYHLVNGLTRGELERLLSEYGEERWAGRIADFIVRARERERIATTGQLAEIVKAAVPAAARRQGGHPARRTFQALRIAVNDELNALEQGLRAALEWLAPGGRLAVISFHSLEDRIVKRRFQEAVRAGGWRLLTPRPLEPGEAEVEANPRARSAKLRVLERSGDPGDGSTRGAGE